MTAVAVIAVRQQKFNGYSRHNCVNVLKIKSLVSLMII